MKFLTSKTWKQLRAQALSRDGNACVLCGSTQKLNVHHIFPRRGFSDLKLELDNLVTLCPKHHAFGPLSCHRGIGTILVMLWLAQNRPAQYQWILQKLNAS